MTYRFERVSNRTDWFELRESPLNDTQNHWVEYRDWMIENWCLWSNTMTVDKCAAPYIQNPEWVTVTYMDYPTNPLHVGTQGTGGQKASMVSTAKHKCTCPWDGPTGVYAVGCKCQGV